jgi:hypothetical protein
VRRFTLAILVCLTAFLIDAAPAFTTIPAVIVYPFSGSSAELDREANARIATTLATQIALNGTVKVIPAKSGVERDKFLTDARSVGANYYVTGFVTPLGRGASVVDQVVSTVSGTMVFSVSDFVTTYADVVNQGDRLRAAILERATRGIAAFEAPPPPAAAPEREPAKATDVNVINLSRRGKQRGHAPLTLAPNGIAAILATGGSADSDARTETGTALALALQRSGRRGKIVSAVQPAAAVCSSNDATVQIASWLDGPKGTLDRDAPASLRVVIYDCNGAIGFDRTFAARGAGAQDALSAAAFDAMSAFLRTKIR